VGRKLPQKQTADRFGVTIKTLDRWRNDPKLAFPQPMRINERLYDDEEALEQWERWRAANPEPKRNTQPPRKTLKIA
jgi:hypothetical protein